MIVSSPSILGYAIDNIRGKLADLKSLGFADPVKMITSSPPILGLAIDNITGEGRRPPGAGLCRPGADDLLPRCRRSSATRSTTSPGKVADLRALGFADPVKMITSSPPILEASRSTTSPGRSPTADAWSAPRRRGHHPRSSRQTRCCSAIAWRGLHFLRARRFHAGAPQPPARSSTRTRAPRAPLCPSPKKYRPRFLYRYRPDLRPDPAGLGAAA